MRDLPIVSVVMPVYNAAGHLAECLDSVAGQTLTDIQIICVDDGSTDDTGEILDRYAQKDARFQVFHQENLGPGPARNFGLARAEGEYLIFLDSDDLFDHRLLETLVLAAQRTHADVTVCRSSAFDSESGDALPSEGLLKTGVLAGREVFSPGEVRDVLFQFTHGWPWDKLLRTEFIRRQGLTYPALPNSQDMVFIFPALALARRISVIGERALIHHRMNRKSSVSNSRMRALEAPWQALCMCRKILKEKGCLEQFEESLLHWAMGFLIWHLNSLSDPEAQERCYQLLRREWFPQIGFDRYPARGYFRADYLKYTLIRVLPYRVYRWVKNRGRGTS